MRLVRLLGLLLGSSVAAAGCTSPGDNSTGDAALLSQDPENSGLPGDETPQPNTAPTPERGSGGGAPNEPRPAPPADKGTPQPTASDPGSGVGILPGGNTGDPLDRDPLELPTTSLDDLLGSR